MRTLLPLMMAGVLTACSQASAPETPASETDEYFVVNLEDYDRELAGNIGLTVGQDGFEAEDVLRLFVTTAGTSEGSNYDISSTVQDGEKYLFGRAFGLADDSVKAMEFLAVIAVNADGTRTLKDYGARMQCWRGANPEEWTTNLCP